MSEKSYSEFNYIFPDGVDTPSHRHIYVLSDGSGSTCESVLMAVLCQFENISVMIHKIPNIRTEVQLGDVISDCAKNEGIIIFTLVTPSLLEALFKHSLFFAVPTIDVLGHVFTRLENLLKISPMGVPGAFRKIDNEYFKRTAAMNFAVKHDDGLGAHNLKEADILLLGVSRSSKTPISIYLSYRGMKVANVPIVLGQELPTEVFEMPRNKVVGLIVEPERLVRIRKSRFRDKHFIPGDYVDGASISEELVYANEIYRKIGCTVLDVTSRSIEEAATDILNIIRRKAKED